MNLPWKAWLRAFREASPHNVSWVNLETGDVRRYNPRRTNKKKLATIEGELYGDEAWVEVPYAESDDEFEEMRRFAVTPGAGRGSRDLLFALADDKPFRAFRDALKKHPDAAEGWHLSRVQEAERRLWAFCKAWELETDHPAFARIDVEEQAWDESEADDQPGLTDDNLA